MTKNRRNRIICNLLTYSLALFTSSRDIEKAGFAAFARLMQDLQIDVIYKVAALYQRGATPPFCSNAVQRTR